MIKSVRLNITDRNSTLVKTEEVMYRKRDMIDTVSKGARDGNCNIKS